MTNNIEKPTADTLSGFKCYHFQNFYLSGAQAGIQSAHSQHVLSKKYALNTHPDEKATDDYRSWVENHETIIVLNGGQMSDLLDLEGFLERHGQGYAWASFRESIDALNGALTNVAVLVPKYVYAFRFLAKDLSWFVDDNGAFSHRTEPSIDRPGYTLEKRFSEEGIADLWIRQYNKPGVTLTWFEAALLQRIASARLM